MADIDPVAVPVSAPRLTLCHACKSWVAVREPHICTGAVRELVLLDVGRPTCWRYECSGGAYEAPTLLRLLRAILAHHWRALRYGNGWAD